MKTMIERIRDLREDSDFKQSHVAQLLGITQQQYSRYETGETELSLRALDILADLYKVSADYLMARTEAKEGIAALNQPIVDAVTVGHVLSDLSALNETARRAVLDYIYLQQLKQKYGEQVSPPSTMPQKK